jgi:hypothetical protein
VVGPSPDCAHPPIAIPIPPIAIPIPLLRVKGSCALIPLSRARRLLHTSFVKLGLEPPAVIAVRGQQLLAVALAASTPTLDGLVARSGRRVRAVGGEQEEGAEREWEGQTVGAASLSKPESTSRRRQNDAPGTGEFPLWAPKKKPRSPGLFSANESSATRDGASTAPAKPRRRGRTIFSNLVPGPEASQVAARHHPDPKVQSDADGGPEMHTVASVSGDPEGRRPAEGLLNVSAARTGRVGTPAAAQPRDEAVLLVDGQAASHEASSGGHASSGGRARPTSGISSPSDDDVDADADDVFQIRVPRLGMAGPGGSRRSARKAALASAAGGRGDIDGEGAYGGDDAR